jgi:hypothetical protein
MAVVSGHTKRFAAASPVARYWLANCVGFSVTGGARGTVERVHADDDPYVPAQLVIRRGRKRRRVPVSAVLEVIPDEQVVVVCGADRAAARRATLGRAAGVVRGRGAVVLERAAVGLGRVGVALGRAAVVAGLIAALLAVLLIALAIWLVDAGKEGVRLVRSLPWQQYGRSARSATTKLWQGLSTRLSRLRTTSSTWISAKRSSRRARTTSST